MNISIKAGLISLVCLLTLMICGIGALALSSVSAINRNVENEATNWLPSVNYVNKLNGAIGDFRVAEGDHVLATTPDGMSSAEADINRLSTYINTLQAKYEPLISSDEERQIYSGYKQDFAAYMGMHDRLLSLSRANRNAEAAQLYKGDMRHLYDSFSDKLDRDVELNNKGAETDHTQAKAQFRSVVLVVWSAIGVAGLLCVAGLVYVLRGVTSPLVGITNIMTTMAGGNLDQTIPFAGKNNEIGNMAKALGVFRDGLKETEQLRQKSLAAEKINEDRLRAERNAIADDFQSKMGGLASGFVTASKEVSDAAQSLAATAEETSRQAQVVSGAAEEAATNVQTVAAATEEMTASINEINTQVSSAATITLEASQEAANTESEIRSLSDAAQSVGEVVSLIAGIASQTNLLALNATIEAARAGDSGKGFAVVASEVKALATQTARATEEIGRKVLEIQNATTRSVDSIQKIVTTIKNVRAISGDIAAAVEQQGAATFEIASNTTLAADGTTSVTENIFGVGRAAEMTGAASTQLMGLSENLSEKAADLQNEVQRFVTQLRTG